MSRRDEDKSVVESYPKELKRRVEREARRLKPALDDTARYLGEDVDAPQKRKTKKST